MIASLRYEEFTFLEELNGHTLVSSMKIKNFLIKKSPFKVKVLDLTQNEHFKMVKFFKGNINSSVSDIKRIFKIPVDVYCISNNTVLLLQNEDKIIPRILCFSNGKLGNSNDSYLLIKPTPSIISPFKIATHNFERNLKKLIISNIPIKSISLTSMKRLKYLSIQNCLLKFINESSSCLLEHCNVSKNLLEKCNIVSKVLYASYNQIKSFKNAYEYKILDLSYNPLNKLSTKAKILVIRGISLSHKLKSTASKIIADFSDKISFENCSKLRYLSINNCGLNRISFDVSRLKILKANNNNLHIVPKLKRCLHAEFRNNHLLGLNAKRLISLDISKNDVVNFSLRNFNSLKHLNIAYNPIKDLRKGKNLVSIISDCDFPFLNVLKCGIDLHKCKKRNGILNLYRIEFILYSSPVTLFLYLEILESNINQEHIDQLLKAFFENREFQSEFSWICLFNYFFNYFKFEIQFRTDSNFSLVLITDKIVIMKSSGIVMGYYNFAKTDKTSNPNSIYIFKNSAFWIIFPLICHRDLFLSTKKWSFSEKSFDAEGFFNYLDINCPLTLDMVVCNTERYFDTNKPLKPTFELINRIEMYHKDSDNEKLLDKINMNYYLNSTVVKRLGLENMDFGVRSFDHSSMVKSNPVFLFMKFNKKNIFDHEVYNIPNLLDFYCRIFDGVMIEKGYKLVIVGFNNSLNSALWSIRVQNSLKSIGIEICIGISGGVVFSREEDGIINYGGPAFNKISRIADLGIGIFCDSDVIFHHPHISKIGQGDRFLKGFKNKVTIFSITADDELV